MRPPAPAPPPSATTSPDQGPAWSPCAAQLLDADSRHGGALVARMLPLAAFGPGHWRNTTLEANEQLVALLARMVPPGTRRQTEVDLSVDLTDALGRFSAPQPAGGAVDVAAQLHEAPIA